MLILTKVDMELAQIWYSTLFGGDGEDAGRAIALAASGDIAIGGQTDSSDFRSCARSTRA